MDVLPWSLNATNLTVSYGSRPVLAHADITLAPGSITAIIGPNGCGKSTLLRSLTRLLTPDTGEIRFPEGPAQALSARAFAQRVALLAQQRPIPAGITVHDVVDYGRHPHRSGWRGTDPEGAAAVENALELAGLRELRDAPVETLSGGQIQRTWLASSLAQDTGVLLLDEPTNHLDLRYQVEVLELVRELADEQRVAIGVVLHDLNHAAEIADRVILMSHGKLVRDAPLDAAFDPDLLSEVYGIPITVAKDPETLRYSIRTRSIRDARTAAPAARTLGQ